jgi:hypothetical protein
MLTRHLFAFVALGFTLAVTARGAADVDHGAVYLYQPDAQMRARLGSAEGLVAHIKRLKAAGAAFFASEQTPESLDVVVGVKPGKKVKVWFVSSRRGSEDKALIVLRKKLEAVPPCAVHGGPIVFALNWTIAGATPTPKQKGESPYPIPQEWRNAGTNLSIPDGVFERIWSH